MALPSEAVSASPVTETAPTEMEKSWAMGAHVGSLLLGFLAPLIVMMTKGNESAFIRRNAVESLNFQLTVTGACIVSGILMVVLIGALLMPLVLLAALAFTIIGGIKAYQGEIYRYPVSIRLVK